VIKVKCVDFKTPVALLGKHIHVYLKTGEDFGFKVTGCGPEGLEGYDNERMNLYLLISDIDFILGG
jgi:hypothetical protein